MRALTDKRAAGHEGTAFCAVVLEGHGPRLAQTCRVVSSACLPVKGTAVLNGLRVDETVLQGASRRHSGSGRQRSPVGPSAGADAGA